MASIELTPLSSHFDDNEIEALEEALGDAGASPLDIDEEGETTLLDGNIDDDLLAELFDRLDVNEAACDVYVPPDFEGVFEVGDSRVGSAHVLILALQELAEELGDGDDDDDDDEDDYGGDDDDDYDEVLGAEEDESFDLKDAELARICKVLQQGARQAIRRGVAMFVLS